MKERKRERGDKKERVRASVRATGIANESFFLRERCCCASEKVRERERAKRAREDGLLSEKSARGCACETERGGRGHRKLRESGREIQ